MAKETGYEQDWVCPKCNKIIYGDDHEGDYPECNKCRPHVTDDPLAKVESFTLMQLHKMWTHEEGPLRDAKFLPEPAIRAVMVELLRKEAKIMYDRVLDCICEIHLEKLADRLENKK